MTVAVVFGFAVADGLVPVVGAAPYEVLARQLPRQLVQLLNAGGDRGARFFPLLGSVNGKRNFLHLRELLPVANLATMHQRKDVTCLIDGAVHETRVRLRIHEAPSQRLRLEAELPFDPRRPFDVLPRLQFEIMGALGWPGRPYLPPPLEGATLAWYLIAKDELLAMEAGMTTDAQHDPLRAVRNCVTAAPQQLAVQEVAIDTAARLLRLQLCRGEIARMLQGVLDHGQPAFAALRRIGALLQAAGDDPAAAAAWSRAAEVMPQSQEAVETAASLWFRAGRLGAAREVLMRARQQGTLGLSGLGQLAAVADRLGDRQLRDELMQELLAVPVLPIPVARLLASFLLEADRAAEARRIADQALLHHGRDAGLLLELARASLLLDDAAAAQTSLRAAIDLGLKGESARDADRLLRLVSVPGMFAAMRQVDAAFAAGDPRTALRVARRLVRVGARAAEAWLFLGIVRQRLGHDFRAERALRIALQLDDNLAEGHNRLGILLVGQGNLELGLQHLLRAELLAPTDPSPRLHLAQAFAMLGKAQDGEHHLAEAERLGANPRTLQAIRQQFFAKGA